MINKSNIDGIKETARLFASLEPEINESFGFIVYHPFVSTIVDAIPGDDGRPRMLNVVDEFETYKSHLIQTINNPSTDLERLSIMITKPYKLTFLTYIEDSLDETDYNKLLRYSYQHSELPSGDVNVSKKKMLDMFKKSKKEYLMSEEEIEYFDKLDDRITIFRGCQDEGDVKALSWTLNIEIARFFADRYGKNGKVFKTTISKSDVIAYFLEEDEIIIDYSKSGFQKDVSELDEEDYK